MAQYEKITFETEEGMVDFYVVDETRISGMNYLLVVDSLEDEAEALILKDVAPEDSLESVYEIVEDETELDVVSGMFEESLGDVEFV